MMLLSVLLWFMHVTSLFMMVFVALLRIDKGRALSCYLPIVLPYE